MTSLDNPLVSIVVPVYNVENYIKECVYSLVNQTLREIEIILVDDGSTDNSAQLCDMYADQYANVKVIHKPNGGLGSARNAGMNVCKGTYIGFVDPDDYVSKDMFQILLKLVLEYNADCAFCELIRFWGKKRVVFDKKKTSIKVYSDKEILDSYLLDRIGCEPFEKQDCTYGASVNVGIFKNSIIKSHNILFESERRFIAEDMLFDIEYISKCHRIVHTDDVLYYYRFNPNSLTTRYVADRFEKNVIFCHEMDYRLNNIYSDKKYRIRIDRYFLKITRIALIEEANHIKTNKWKNTSNNVHRIINNTELENILSRYPISQMPFKQRLFFKAVKNKSISKIMTFIKFHTIIERIKQELLIFND